MDCETSILLLVAFILSFTLALTLYAIGDRISSRGRVKREGKTIPYACGEEPPSIKGTRMNYERFFIFTIFFMIFDVFAFMIAISYSAPKYLPVLYSLITMMAVIVLLVARKEV